MTAIIADEDINEIHAFGRKTQVSRVLGQYGSGKGPTVVVIAGLHGNEPAGVVAVQEFLKQLTALSLPFRGRFIGLSGNLAALAKGVRYIDVDMNRMWRPEFLRSMNAGGQPKPEAVISERRELGELYAEIQRILGTESGPFYFIDLHTTSSLSPPFIPYDDSLANREFVRQFPVPRILGIEEFLPGTLLSYMVRYGVVAFGYEAGQHNDPHSVDYHRAMLALSVERAGCVNRQSFEEIDSYEELLRQSSQGIGGFYEILYRHSIREGEDFRMLPGFESFQKVNRKQQVATNVQGAISVDKTAQIFMPLYQSQGDDGFFLIRRVSRLWLELSRSVRKWRLERWIARLPGVQLIVEDASTLLVDPRVARFLSIQIFHLLGYRRVPTDGSLIRFTRRER